MGMIDVAAFAASVAGVLIGVTITATRRRTISAASAGGFIAAFSPAVFDRHILTIEVPGLVQAFVKRGNVSANVEADALCRNPITGIAGCCARAASGHAAAPPAP
jgi:hypothetical protein